MTVSENASVSENSSSAEQSSAAARQPLAKPMARIVAQVKVPVTVLVGEGELSLQELLELAPGAVVPLSQAVGEPVQVLVAGCPVARGELVMVQGRLAVRITEILAGREETAG
jgi:flagellar motor switch protein FliN/FliY